MNISYTNFTKIKMKVKCHKKVKVKIKMKKEVLIKMRLIYIQAKRQTVKIIT